VSLGIGTHVCDHTRKFVLLRARTAARVPVRRLEQGTPT